MSGPRLPVLDAAIILIGIALQRLPFLGNPHLNIDEQFYLLTGTRMLHGALPYIDIWDRKPIGLFLIYAFAGLFEDGIWAYQLLALAALGATGLLLYRMARRYADRPSAIVAALCYPAILHMMQGAGGQSPIFYNLTMTLAALLVMQVMTGEWAGSRKGLVWRGVWVMLLVGVSMQVKYNALFEGIFFGCALLWASWRRAGLAFTVRAGLLWIAVALLPTALAWLFYAVQGASDEFLFANFLSIFLRHPFADSGAEGRLIRSLKMIGLPIGIGLLSHYLGRRKGAMPWGGELRFIGAWTIAGFVAYLAFPPYFMHYAMPLVVPALLIFASAGRVWLLLRIALVGYAVVVGIEDGQEEATFQTTDSSYARIDTALRDSRNCPFIYSGPSMYYQTGGHCLPTRYPFPYHINMIRERGAIGIDSDAELARILSRRPDFILMHWPPFDDMHPNSQHLLLTSLKRDYRKVFSGVDPHYAMELYRLKPGVQPLPNIVVPAVPGRVGREPLH
ncbi:glycosyltransferase family 39 protein [Sphingobium sufflavum]|uniref:ArnT family glycosyltransferase n=1 Tax=Sphingobium sufflavum TaxID=1129547 RepID=UPI001F36EBF8|nr:glycosyltransferase family 39 protein [Sphingobium sufflavum]MCE7798741.1 glycosyltransferase family 39 protein [Sphingobium sufflavum]